MDEAFALLVMVAVTDAVDATLTDEEGEAATDGVVEGVHETLGLVEAVALARPAPLLNDTDGDADGDADNESVCFGDMDGEALCDAAVVLPLAGATAHMARMRPLPTSAM